MPNTRPATPKILRGEANRLPLENLLRKRVQRKNKANAETIKPTSKIVCSIASIQIRQHNKQVFFSKLLYNPYERAIKITDSRTNRKTKHLLNVKAQLHASALQSGNNPPRYTQVEKTKELLANAAKANKKLLEFSISNKRQINFFLPHSLSTLGTCFSK
jgi:hypothetical protein